MVADAVPDVARLGEREPLGGGLAPGGLARVGHARLDRGHRVDAPRPRLGERGGPWASELAVAAAVVGGAAILLAALGVAAGRDPGPTGSVRLTHEDHSFVGHGPGRSNVAGPHHLASDLRSSSVVSAAFRSTQRSSSATG